MAASVCTKSSASRVSLDISEVSRDQVVVSLGSETLSRTERRMAGITMETSETDLAAYYARRRHSFSPTDDT